MKKIKIFAFMALLLILESCQINHHKGVIAITFANGDKDTLSAEWDGELILRKGNLHGDEPIFQQDIACGVRTFKILSDEKKDQK